MPEASLREYGRFVRRKAPRVTAHAADVKTVQRADELDGRLVNTVREGYFELLSGHGVKERDIVSEVKGLVDRGADPRVIVRDAVFYAGVAVHDTGKGGQEKLELLEFLKRRGVGLEPGVLTWLGKNGVDISMPRGIRSALRASQR
jgi:hypothetical protein